MKAYTKEQLKEILEKHQKWLDGKEDGECADLSDSDLWCVDLSGYNLQGCNLSGSYLKESYLSGSNLCGCNLNSCDLQESDLHGCDFRGCDLRDSILYHCNLKDCNLRGSDLTGSELRRSDLRGSDIDFSCWPLWYGSLDVKVDKRIFAQLAYHLCRVIVDDEECKAAQAALYPIANQFHRVKACGRLPITREDAMT